MDLPREPWSLTTPAAVDNRDALVRFWLAAPLDQLQALWHGPIGEATRQLIRQLTPSSAFSGHQVALRDAINQRLMQGGLQQPIAPQLIVAVFLYSPPGLMQIANPDQLLPAWLASAYHHLYQSQTGAHQAQAAPAARPLQPNPDFGSMPGTLQELVGNRIQLNRMLGLSNLYYIDPEDQEILNELLLLRSQLAELILQAPEQTLETVWATDFGDRYWAMVRSGVQQEPLPAGGRDALLKHRVTQALSPASGGGFGAPGSLNAFLVAMLFYQPGSMKVDAAEQKLPAWLLPHYQQIFAEPLAAAAH